MRRTGVGAVLSRSHDRLYLRITWRSLERIEPRQHVGITLPSRRPTRSGESSHFLQGSAFGFNIRSCIVIGGIEAGMSKPVPNYGHVYTRRDKRNCGRMATMSLKT